VKVFLPGRGMDESGIKLFSKEYSLVLNLDHPHLLTALHFDVYNGSPYLILPYCAGGNLYSRLQSQGRFDEKEVAQIGVQISDALSFMHEKKILHQDIKPDNILIRSLGKYVLSDFGISFQLRRSMTQTMRGTVEKYTKYYTPFYAPPEKYKQQEADLPGDIFSLGVTLYELASGNLPFENTGKAIEGGASIPPIPHISQELNQILEACMSLDPAMRPEAHQVQFWAGYYLETGSWGVLKRKQPKEKVKKEAKASWLPDSVVNKKPDAPEKRATKPRKRSGILKNKSSLLLMAAVLLVGSLGLGFLLSSGKGFSSTPWQSYQGGENEAGLPEGTGKAVYKNGDVYEGEWVNGLPHGQGIQQYQNGNVYEGQFAHGVKQGRGMFTYKSGDRYEGAYQQGKMNGQGTFFYADGEKYIGGFQADAIEGMGRYVDANDSILGEGVWKAGELVKPKVEE
ncbi:MAG: protein kinase, partial [Bacteroidota bacterium]